MFENIKQAIDRAYNEMVEIRRYLHQHPELSFKEVKTAAYIVDFYKRLNIPFKEKVGGNGIIATLKGGNPGKTIALRADFDALPIHDEKDVPYRSKVDGVMHACGHDGHTATLLMLAKVLNDFQSELPGTVVFLHQHAEELSPGGAKPIIESGELDHVDAFFGTHLWSVTPLGHIETSKNVLMAGADRFQIILQGQGGHGSAPHETKDAIAIGAQLVTQLQHIVSRKINPLQTAVISIGKFQAGSAFNVIADKALLQGTVRYLDTSMQHKVIEEMERTIKGVCLANDITYEFEYNKGYPPLMNHEKEAELILATKDSVEDITEMNEIEPKMASEDFAYYLLEKPGAFFFTGAMKEKDIYPHHHPKFDFDERAMPIAAKTLIKAYLNYQEQHV